jgi:hypothetical protein
MLIIKLKNMTNRNEGHNQNHRRHGDRYESVTIALFNPIRC